MKLLARILLVGFIFGSSTVFADALNYGQLPTMGVEVQMTEEAEFQKDRWEE